MAIDTRLEDVVKEENSVSQVKQEQTSFVAHGIHAGENDFTREAARGQAPETSQAAVDPLRQHPSKQISVKEEVDLEMRNSSDPGKEERYGDRNCLDVKEEWISDVEECAVPIENEKIGAYCEGHIKQEIFDTDNIAIQLKEEPCDWPDLATPSEASDHVKTDPLSLDCSLITHKVTHASEKPKACEYCDYRCTSKSTLLRHTRVHTGEKPYACNSCDYKTSCSFNLKTHVSIHTDDKPYKCDECEHESRTKRNLKRHIMKIHTGEKPYACDTCERRFATKSKLEERMTLHSEDNACNVCNIRSSKKTSARAQECNICHIRYANRRQLKIHMTLHTGEKRYTCDQCDFRCRLSGQLLPHKRRMHTKEQPFACNLCDFRFYDKADLNRHQRTQHTKWNPFSCNECDYTCNSGKFLEFHMRIHTGIRLFKCEICCCDFKTYSILARHMNKHKIGCKPIILKI